MGKKTGKEKSKRSKNRRQEPATVIDQEMSLERFLGATMEELIMAIRELPDGIILEVYFDQT